MVNRWGTCWTFVQARPSLRLSTWKLKRLLSIINSSLFLHSNNMFTSNEAVMIFLLWNTFIVLILSWLSPPLTSPRPKSKACNAAIIPSAHLNARLSTRPVYHSSNWPLCGLYSPLLHSPPHFLHMGTISPDPALCFAGKLLKRTKVTNIQPGDGTDNVC